MMMCLQIQQCPDYHKVLGLGQNWVIISSLGRRTFGDHPRPTVQVPFVEKILKGLCLLSQAWCRLGQLVSHAQELVVPSWFGWLWPSLFRLNPTSAMWPRNVALLWINSHFSASSVTPACLICSRAASNRWLCSVLLCSGTSLTMQTTPCRPARISDVVFWKCSGAEVIPN